MPAFLTRLVAEKIGRRNGRAIWRLQEELRYVTADGQTITVPAGFETDFSSVPRLPVAFWLAGDSAHRPSVVHDWLCRMKIGSRRRADAIFFEAMGVDGEPLWRRWIMWSAVRAFGWAA